MYKSIVLIILLCGKLTNVNAITGETREFLEGHWRGIGLAAASGYLGYYCKDTITDNMIFPTVCQLGLLQLAERLVDHVDVNAKDIYEKSTSLHKAC